MKVRRGKLVGLGAVGLGIVVLLIAVFASRRVVLEEWRLSNLKSADEETRKKAAQALGEYGSARSIPLLMKANSDSLTSILERAGKPLAGMETSFASMLDQQAKLARRLSETSPDAAQAPDDLSTRRQQIFMANQRAAFDMRVADLAAQVATRLAVRPYSRSLRRIVEREKAASVPYLLQALESDNWHLRWLAVTFLGTLGSDAKDAVPDLEGKLEDSNSFVHCAAAEALKSIGHDDER